MSTLAAVVLCAGKGTRMKSARAKLLHPLLGRPLCAYPVSRALELGASPVVAVVGHQAEQVTQALQADLSGQPLRFAHQTEQRGTGHAVRCAQAELKDFRGPILILNGDVPLLRRETLEALVTTYRQGKGPLALVSTVPEEPTGYGRLIRKGRSAWKVVEEKDCTPVQRKIREVNAGIYVVDSEFLWKALEKLTPSNAQGELYLTDLVELAARLGPVSVMSVAFTDAAGVNDRAELAARAKVLQERINLRHMKDGVTLDDPATAYIADSVQLAEDVVVGPGVTLVRSQVARGARIGQGCILVGASVGEGTEVKPYSVFEDAKVGAQCLIGPFARLRPGTVLADRVHIGNFVEIKKTEMGPGSKANHLAYLGDALIGSGVNVGAGTITCNYDGVNKHQTVLGDNVFIGSDTQLVAPVKVGDGAYVGAGTTVTRDVPAMSLTLSRAPQIIKEGWVAKRKDRAPALVKKSGS